MIPAQILFLNTHAKLDLTEITCKNIWSNHSAFSSAIVTWREKHLIIELVPVTLTESGQEKYAMNKRKKLGPYR